MKKNLANANVLEKWHVVFQKAFLYIWLPLFLSTVQTVQAQINTNKISVDLTSLNFKACSDDNNGLSTVTVLSKQNTTTDFQIAFDLPDGVFYQAGSGVITAQIGSNDFSFSEVDISNLNQPVFRLERPSNAPWQINDQVTFTYQKTADCDAVQYSYGGGLFKDAHTITFNDHLGAQTASDNDLSVNSYNVFKAFLAVDDIASISGAVGDTQSRNIVIRNSGNGSVQVFEHQVTISSNLLAGYSLSFNGSVLIPSTISGGVFTYTINLNAAPFLGAVGDGDNLFENESITLVEEVTLAACSWGENTRHSPRWGCTVGTYCQVGTAIPGHWGNVFQEYPNLSLTKISHPSAPRWDAPVTYTNRISNNPTAENAYNVKVNIGYSWDGDRSSESSNTLYGDEHTNNRRLDNFRFAGGSSFIPVRRAYTTDPDPSFGPGSYFLPADFFAFDPDGPGGLDDLDGDGFFDDLAPGLSTDVQFDLTILPLTPVCSIDRSMYLQNEQLRMEVWSVNTCNNPSFTQRIDINSSQVHAEALFNWDTPRDHDTDALPGQPFHLTFTGRLDGSWEEPTCNGTIMFGNEASTSFRAEITVPNGVTLDASADARYSQSGNTVTFVETALAGYVVDFYSLRIPIDFPLNINCGVYSGPDYLVMDYRTFYDSSCFDREIHCGTFGVQTHCPDGCSAPTTTSFEANRVTPGWTDDTMATNVVLDENIHATKYYMAKDEMVITSSAVMRNDVKDNLYLEIQYVTDNSGVNMADVIDFTSGTITINDLSSGIQTTAITVAPTVNTFGINDNRMTFDLSSYRSIISPTYQYGEGFEQDEIEVELHFTFKNSFPESNRLYQFHTFSGTFYSLSGTGSRVSCDVFGDRAFFFENTVGIQSTIGHQFVTGCDEKWLWIQLEQSSGIDDKFPNEFRPPVLWQSATIEIPQGMQFNGEASSGSFPFLMPENQQPATWNNGLTFSALGNTVTITPGPRFRNLDQGGNHYPSFSIPLTATSSAIENTPYTVSATYEEFAYANSPEVKTESLLEEFDYFNLAFNIHSSATTVIGNSQLASFTLEVGNGSAQAIDYNWLRVDPGANFQMTNAYLVNGPLETPLNIVTEANIYYIEFGDMPAYDTSLKTIRFEGTYDSCDPQVLRVSQNYDCTGYPSTYTGLPFFHEILLTLQPVPATLQLAILSQPVTTVDMCTDYNVVLEVRNAGEGDLVSPMVAFDVPGDISSVNIADISVEYPRNSGNIQSLTPTIAGNTVSIDLLQHTAIAADNGIAGSYGSGGLDQQIAIINMALNPQCNYRSNTGTEYVVTGNNTCGAPAVGSGSRLASEPIIITGAEPPYSTSNAIIGSPSFEGCEIETLNVETLILGGTTGANDFTRIILPPGLLYVAGSFTSTGTAIATFVTTNTVGDHEEIEIALPVGAGIADVISYSFNLESTAFICSGNYNLALSTFVNTSGLSCGGVACGTTEIETGVANAQISIDKGLPTQSSFAATAEYVQGSPNTDYVIALGLENTGLVDLASGMSYEVFCADGSGVKTGAAIHAGTIGQAIPVGASIEETITFNSSSFCGANSNIVVEFAPGGSNCFCSLLSVVIASQPATVFGNVTFVNDNITVNEAVGTATLEVIFNGTAPGGFTVDFTTLNNTAVALQDYLATTGSLTFAGTDGEIQTITIPILDDVLAEPTENFWVELSNISLPVLTILDNQAVVNITDNDLEICNDGIDNDGDGLVDCADPDCYLAANSGDSDNDGDGIGDSCDVDDDNDGIFDSDESLDNIPDDYFMWSHNLPGNQNRLSTNSPTEELVVPGASNDWYLSNYANESIHGNLSGSIPQSSLLLTNMNAINLQDAITRNDYVEYSFTTSSENMDFYITRIASLVDERVAPGNDLHGDSYDHAVLMSDDNFTTHRVIAQDVYHADQNNTSTKDDYFYHNSFDPSLRLTNNTTYTFRVYFYNNRNDRAGRNYIVFDDFYIRFTTNRLRDTDGDTIYDHLDLDSDNDGCFDVVEANHTDGDNDGILGNSPVTVDNAGQVTGQGGYTGTNAYVVTPFVPVVIGTQPVDQVANMGDTVTFTASATGGATLSYQWQESTDNGATWAAIANGGIYSGATTNSLTLTGVGATQNGYDYRLVVISNDNNCDTPNSTAANLLVNTTEICNDGIDNDGDGLVDCDDPDCYLAANSGDADNDGDGIGDSCDVDDDNDGVLDVNECDAFTILNLAGNPTQINGVPIGGVTGLNNGDIVTISNAGNFADGTPLGVRIVVSNIGNGAEYDPAVGMISANNLRPTNGDYIEFYVEAFDALNGNLLLFDGEAIFTDIDSQGGSDYTELLGILPSYASTLGANIMAVNYGTGGPGAGQNYFGVNPATSGAINNWADEDNINPNNAAHWVTINVDNINRLELTFGVTGTHNFDLVTRDLLLSDISVRRPCDTDGDGLPNDVDLDADNDGCFDTMEAGHTDGDNDGILGNSPVTVDNAGQVTGQGGYTGTNPNVTTALVPVVIATQPVDQVANMGDTVTFTASASGGATLSYQWQESTDNGTTWADIANGGIYSGATTNSLTITGVGATQNGYDYRLVVVSNDNNCDTPASTAANLLVNTTEICNDGVDNDGDGLVDCADPDCYLAANSGDVDNDGDGIGNTCDLDDDDDGILDTNEMQECIDDDYFAWNLNSPVGTRTNDFVQNPAITNWLVTGTTNLATGSGLVDASPGSELQIDGIDANTVVEAIQQNEYVEVSFTTGVGLVNPIIERMGMNWYQNSDGTTVGNSYDAAIAISDDNFATYVMLNTDVRLHYPTNGVTEFFDLTAPGANLALAENTTYTIRVYAYNQQGDGNVAYSVFDDFTVRVSSCLVIDTDSDTIPNHLDPDSDNDGCFDAMEAGHTDGDNDGILGNSPVTVDNAGQVTGQGGYTGTNAYVVTPFVPVVIGTQPVDQVANMGDTVTFTASATGGATLSYQWQESTDNGVSWGDIANGGIYSGATTTSLTLTGVGATQNGNDYRLVVISNDNNCDTPTSTAANLLVNTTEICNDGMDNDGDGLVDCADPDCYLAANSGDADNDGDGIGNTCDLDDDNDGIPDIHESGNFYECSDTFVLDGAHTVNTHTSTVLNTTASGIGYDFQTVNGITLDTSVNPALSNFVAYPMNPEFTNAQTHLMIAMNTDRNVGQHANFTITFPNPVQNPTIYFGDLKNSPGVGLRSVYYNLVNTGVDMDLLWTDNDFYVSGTTIGTRFDIPGSRGTGLVRFNGVFDELTFTVGHASEVGDDGLIFFGINIGYYDCIDTGYTINPDTDGDGIINSLDLDSDNDGVFDAVEAGHGQPHTNGRLNGPIGVDGLPDSVRLLSNDALINYDVSESTQDTDLVPNYLDLDSDGDGIPDHVEAQTTLGYMAPNGTVDANGVDIAYPAGIVPTNTDGTDEPDYLDLDADNEGGNDTVEAAITLSGNDADGDGLDDATDATTGYADVGGTIDNPLTAPVILPDLDNDATTGGDVDFRDATNDSMIDLDTDDDGITDLVEDQNTDGDNDPFTNPNDTDADGIPDYLDIDSDDDGIPDNVEAQTTAGYIPPSGTDTNMNGLDDAYENNGNLGITPVDTDADLLPDYLDADSDNDNVPDHIEGHDHDHDGIADVDFIGSDKDNDGLDDNYEGSQQIDIDVNDEINDPINDLPNTDGDAESDYRDTDDDNDGIPTMDEDANNDGNYANDDFDNDGIPDYLDPDQPVEIDEVEVFNIVTPNKDNVHDYLIITGLDVRTNNFLQIYNRWGILIYETSSYNTEGNVFDGTSQGRATVRKGEKLPVGTYFYILDYEDLDGTWKKLTGYLYLN